MASVTVPQSALSSLPTKRALLVGINYTGQAGQLFGCVNDVRNVQALLEKRGFTQVTALHDELGADSEFYPTRANILAQLERAVAETRSGDTFFFHYSGHGSWRYTTNPEEIDGRDECICPVDYATAGVLWDNDLHEVLIRKLPANCVFRAVMDCCHSGTALDLRYNFAKYPRFSAIRYWKNPAIENTPYDAKMLSGSQDAQTSADAWIDGAATGALTHAFLECYENDARPTCAQLLLQTNNYMEQNKYTQRPEMSSGAKLNIFSARFLD